MWCLLCIQLIRIHMHWLKMLDFAWIEWHLYPLLLSAVNASRNRRWKRGWYRVPWLGVICAVLHCNLTSQQCNWAHLGRACKAFSPSPALYHSFPLSHSCSFPIYISTSRMNGFNTKPLCNSIKCHFTNTLTYCVLGRNSQASDHMILWMRRSQ